MGIHKASWPYPDAFDVQNLSVESTFASDGTSKFNGPVQFEGTPGVAGQMLMSYGPDLSPQWVSFQTKEQVKAATTGNIVGTYANNALTTTAIGILYIDGYLTQLDDRILIKDQTDKTQNGIYIVDVVGSIGAQTVFLRDNDADTAAKLAIALVPVDLGTVYGGSQWVSTTKATDILGTSTVSFNQVLDSGSIANLTRKPTRPTTTSPIIQSNLGNRAMWRYYPSTLNATTVTTEGFANATQYGTAATATWANTNQFTRARRVTIPTTSTAASAGGYRFPTASFTTGSGTTGGFYYACKFGFASATEATFVAASRTFVGMSSTTTSLTNAEPSTFLNCVGVGQGAADTTFKIFYGGSAAQTPIDTGISFTTASRDIIYELTLYSPSNTNNYIYYTFTNLNTAATVSGTLSGNTGISLPNSTTNITPQTWRTNNATASVADMSLIYLYMETES